MIQPLSDDLMTRNDGLTLLRERIDGLDAQIIALLGERFTTTRLVGKYKHIHDLQAVDTSREQAQFERIERLAVEAGVPPQLAAEVLRWIIDTVVQEHKAV